MGAPGEFCETVERLADATTSGGGTPPVTVFRKGSFIQAALRSVRFTVSVASSIGVGETLDHAVHRLDRSVYAVDRIGDVSYDASHRTAARAYLPSGSGKSFDRDIRLILHLNRPCDLA